MRLKRLVQVSTGLTLAAILAIGCGEDEPTGPGPSPSGTIRVSLDMTGTLPDPDGCLVFVDSADTLRLHDGETHAFTDLSTGAHTVTITDLAENCATRGDPSRSVTVIADDTTAVDFTLDCPAPGVIEVTTQTVGSVVDPDGYAVELIPDRVLPTGVNDTVTFEGLSSREYSVRLTGMADNCSVIGDNPERTAIEEGETARISFGVACPPFYDYIAFSSDRNGGSEIFVTGVDGAVAVSLTPDVWAFEPAWSPDGSRIAFTGPSDSREIFVMAADGSYTTNLTNHPDGDYEAAWSPDGRQIAFNSYRDYQVTVEPNSIFIMDDDGSNPTKIITADCVGWPSWSPDGLQIAYNASCGPGGFDIFVADTDGSNPTNLTNAPGDDLGPSWSPDGSRVVFNSNRAGDTEIYVMDADGSNVVQLTDNDAEDFFPAWSPDGTRIAFVSSRDGNLEIYVMGADGSDPVNVTNHPAQDERPTWSPGQ